MDIEAALRDLWEEKKRLDQAIDRLETRLKATTARLKGRRGRKEMGPAERLEVSRRMQAYWSARRAKRQSESSSAEEEPEPRSANGG